MATFTLNLNHGIAQWLEHLTQQAEDCMFLMFGPCPRTKHFHDVLSLTIAHMLSVYSFYSKLLHSLQQCPHLTYYNLKYHVKHAIHLSLGGSMVRVSHRQSEGYRFDSCPGLGNIF